MFKSSSSSTIYHKIAAKWDIRQKIAETWVDLDILLAASLRMAELYLSSLYKVLSIFEILFKLWKIIKDIL